MKNDKFVCPICGSTHFEHIIPKVNKNIFGIRCTRCVKYVGWLPKTLYNAWRNGEIEMDKIKPSTDTKNYMEALDFFKEIGFKQINAYTLSNDTYVIRLDKEKVLNKKTNKKMSLDDFVEIVEKALNK